MNVEFNLSYHHEILAALARWKVLTLKNLYIASGYGATYNAFKKAINRLEEVRLLKTKRIPLSLRKIVYLSQNYLNNYYKESNLCIDDNTLYHDSTVSNTSRSILMLSQFISVELPHELALHDDGIEPDAILKGVNKQKFNLGLEIELNQKSSNRINSKFLQYCRSSYFNHALYFFEKEALYNIYKKRLDALICETSEEKIKSTLPKRIILGFNQDLNLEGFNIKNSLIYHKGKELQLGELFS